jgi:hypothetical protein
MHVETAITPPPAPQHAPFRVVFADVESTVLERDETVYRPASTLFHGAWQAYLRRVLPPVSNAD